jgi:ferric-dicitrate binding protein FerR (iron transport regulator)
MAQEEIVRKWLNETLNETERLEFERSDEYKSIRRLSDSLMYFKAPDYDIEAEVARLNLTSRTKGKIAKMPLLRPWMRAAAVLIILFSTFFYFYVNRYSEVHTSYGETAELYLPDSSKVLLNAQSVISFKRFGWTTHREVTLDGEAYFEVAKGKQFSVVTTSGTTSVLGTKFNVKHRDGYFEVLCFEGSVRVISRDQAATLDAGKGFRLLNNTVTMLQPQSGAGPSWTQGQSDFVSVPLIQVIREFERQYNKTVTAQGVDLDELYTGSFKHNNEALAIQAITIPMNLNWKADGEHTIILTARSE